MNAGNMMDELYLLSREFPWFAAVAVFIFGACWGSFLNVCIYRMPKGESVVTPRSHCSCGKLIPWYDNIPIVSWLVLRGRARCCGAHFSVRYAVVESLTGGLFVAAFLLLPPAQALPGMVFVAILIAASFIDLDHMILPNLFTVGGTVVGVLLSFLVPGLHGFSGGDPWLVEGLRSGVMAMIGAVVGAGVILWIMELAELILRKEAMGYGDVVFMGCIGAFCGWQGALFAIFGGAFIGALLIIPVVLAQRIVSHFKSEKEPVAGQLKKTEADEETEPALGFGVAVPFGPWLALGGLLYFLIMRAPVDAYFSQLKEVVFTPLS